MFKHEFQGGPCVEVFSAQGKDVKHSQWKLAGSGIKKVFDKEVKSFIFTLEGTTSSTKIQLPKEVKQNLGLTQGILVLQIHVPQGLDLALELGVMDSADQKCRLAFSTAFKETQVIALHVKIPLALIKRNVWLNLCIDLRSLIRENLKTSSYKSLESICVSGNCRLRRIFTMRNQAPDTTNDDELYGTPDINAEVELESIPKQCQLVADVQQVTQVINALKLQCYEGKTKSVEFLSTSRNAPVRETDMSSSVSAADSQVPYHIAFGSKVPIPTRHQLVKEGNTTNRSTDIHQNSDVSADLVASRPPSYEELQKLQNGRKTRRKQIPDTKMTAVDVTREKESLITSHTDSASVVDVGSTLEDGPVVKPHPPRNPSSEKSRRRRPRVKSSGNDPNPYISDGVLSSGSSESQKADLNLKRNSEPSQQVSNATEKVTVNLADLTTDSDTGSIDSAEYNELIKDLNKNELRNGDKENFSTGNKVYVFSSRPTCIDNTRARTKQPRRRGLVSAPSRKAHDLDMKPNNLRRPASENTPRSRVAATSDSAFERHFELKPVANFDSFDKSPQRKPLKNQMGDSGNSDFRSSTKSQTRQSINRKSLREIPVEELQRSGGQKPYSFAKYQVREVTESFEQQMLLSMQREAATDTMESEDEPSPTHLPLGYDAMTDSSDDLSTLKSPQMLKNQSHNYQEEITNLGQNFMTQSNPRDWADVFSPPIVLPSSTHPKHTAIGHGVLKPSELGCSSNHKNAKKKDEADTDEELDEELDLLYDPELHYFYDPRTTKYYELITSCSNAKTSAFLSRR